MDIKLHVAHNEEHVLLWLSGWSSTRERQHDRVILTQAETELGVLVVEYSGHGSSLLSLDETCQAQYVLETVRAYDYLRKRFPHSRISVLGSSFGGYLALNLLHLRSISRVIFVAAALYDYAYL